MLGCGIIRQADLSLTMTYDNYPVALVPRILGGLLVWAGNLVYGHTPSYLKFRAVEVIARVPYHSWDSAAFTLLTMFYMNEARALKYAHLSSFARHAQDNETMHVVVISQLAKRCERAGFIRHTLIPMLFAFLYFWASYWLYILNPRWSFELNYLFEQHAYDQYSEFLSLREADLKAQPIVSDYLAFYGRQCATEYDFFKSVRDDELMHRNASLDAISAQVR